MTSREEQIENLGIAMHEALALAETYQALYEEARKKYHAASTAAYWGRDFQTRGDDGNVTIEWETNNDK